MYQHLDRITLKSGEVVQAGVVRGAGLGVWGRRSTEGPLLPLLQALEIPESHTRLAYCDAGLDPKATALTAAGFRCSATLNQRVAADRAQTDWVDVEVWENKGSFQADGSVMH